jgi:hypothetical protein
MQSWMIQTAPAHLQLIQLFLKLLKPSRSAACSSVGFLLQGSQLIENCNTNKQKQGTLHSCRKHGEQANPLI